jgi:flagellar biogenesis protein FliO
MIDETLLRAFLTLLLCVAALGVVLVVVRRYSSKITPQRQSIELKAVGRLPVHKGAVYAVQAGGRTLLIGATDNSINLIADITEQSPLTITDSAPNQQSIIPPETSDSLSFSSFLQSISQRPTPKNGKV